MQKKQFRGALLYDRDRDQQYGVYEILKICLKHYFMRDQIVAEDYDIFFHERSASQKKFAIASEKFWYIHPDAGDFVFSTLKKAGYEGTIDDLWLSIYGKWKPSIPTAFCVHVEGDDENQTRPWWATKGARVISTGQTRKSGSHKS